MRTPPALTADGPALARILRDAGIMAGPDVPVPAARPVLSLGTSDLAGAPGGSR